MHSKIQASFRKRLLKRLLNYLDYVLRGHDTDPSSNLFHETQEVKRLLGSLGGIRLKGAETRARIQWCKDKAKPTKFSLNLEKSRVRTKSFDKIRKPENTITSDTDEILQVQEDFYQELYRSTEISLEKQETSLNDMETIIRC